MSTQVHVQGEQYFITFGFTTLMTGVITREWERPVNQDLSGGLLVTYTLSPGDNTVETGPHRSVLECR